MKYKVISQKTEFHSFDIFDTLVTRRTASPIGIFSLMQNEIKKSAFPEILKNNFYNIRIKAEEFARFKAVQSANTVEINFNDIYEVIQNNYNLTDNEIKSLKDLEISIEIKNLIPVTRNIETLKKQKILGNRVILISDMYYSASDLRYILSHIDSVFNDIKIYSSSDFKVSKSNTELYKIVKEKESVFEKWIHYGDNYSSDVKRASECGILTKHLPKEELMPYEIFLLSGNENNYFYQGIIGCAKTARMKKPDNHAEKFCFGASFAAPILYNYTDWIIQTALAKGVKNLYFTARGGYILQIIADIIIKKKNLNIKTKYIHGSRLAWRIPNTSSYDDITGWFFEEYGSNITPEFLAYRFGIETSEIVKMLGAESEQTKLSPKKRFKYAEKFKTDSKIKDRLISLNKEKNELLLEYLKQEIDFSESDIMFVDLHGSGRTQDCIADLINTIHPCRIYSLYLTNSLLNQKENSIKLCYLSSKQYLSHWIELLCRTFEGQTIGYKKENGKIIPVAEKANPKLMSEWGLDAYINGIKEFTYQILDMEHSNKCSFNTMDIFCRYTDYLYSCLDKDTADIIGEIPYKAIGNEENITCAAPKLDCWQILTPFIFCCKNPNFTEFLNISYARSSVLCRKIVMFTAKYPTLQKFLFNIYVNKNTKSAFICIFGLKISFRRLLGMK